MRRAGERERNREQRDADIRAFWALPPEERAQRMRDSEAFQRISKNGITLEDVRNAETEAFNKGVNAGIESTMRTCYAAICMALQERYGFGRKRCKDVLNDVDERITMSLTSEEAIQEVYDRMGLEIVFRDSMPGDRIQEVG